MPCAAPASSRLRHLLVRLVPPHSSLFYPDGVIRCCPGYFPVDGPLQVGRLVRTARRTGCWKVVLAVAKILFKLRSGQQRVGPEGERRLRELRPFLAQHEVGAPHARLQAILDGGLDDGGDGNDFFGRPLHRPFGLRQIFASQHRLVGPLLLHELAPQGEFSQRQLPFGS